MVSFSEFFFKVPQTLRFLFVGGLNHAFGTTVILILQYLLGDYLFPQAIYILGYVLCTWPCFYSQQKLVFESSGELLMKFIKYFFTSGAISLFGIVFLYVLYDLLHLQVYLSQFLALTLNAIASFLLLKFFVFKNKPMANR